MTDAITLPRLRDLPPPDIIETLDFETIYEALRADTQALFDAAGIAYTVGALETDPVQIVLQAAAYRELLLRARTNDAARANLPLYAGGGDLDHLSAFFDVVRLADETDTALRARLMLAIAGRSAGGPEERYRAVAHSASARVDEVAVYQVDGGPGIEIAVLATDNGGTPDQALLDAVTAAVTNPAVQLVGDAITVVSAVKIYVDVVVDIWLLPGAPETIVTESEARLRDAWAVSGQIGFDLNPSWIAARLFVDGVSRVVVTAPAAPVVARPHEAIALQTVTVTFKGRSR